MYVLTIFFGGFIKVDMTTAEGICLYIATSVPFYCGLGLMELGMGAFYELLLEGDFANFKYAGQDVFRKGIPQRQVIYLEEDDDDKSGDE